LKNKLVRLNPPNTPDNSITGLNNVPTRVLRVAVTIPAQMGVSKWYASVLSADAFQLQASLLLEAI